MTAPTIVPIAMPALAPVDSDVPLLLLPFDVGFGEDVEAEVSVRLPADDSMLLTALFGSAETLLIAELVRAAPSADVMK
jgi:hypothetical protein